jgi:hypothetical protein
MLKPKEKFKSLIWIHIVKQHNNFTYSCNDCLMITQQGRNM